MIILKLTSLYIVHILFNWCKAETEMRLYFIYLLFYCAYYFELVQSRNWYLVILQLNSVYIVNNLLNWCKAEAVMWLYCSHLLFILCIIYWTGAKQWLRCDYISANFCFHWAYSIELVQIRYLDEVILNLSSVYTKWVVLTGLENLYNLGRANLINI